MCGIAGLLAPDIDIGRLQAAADALAHRGPDDAGFYTAPGIALAARRLSILDIAGGHQPLSNEDGTLWIAYNGEVMNAPALRHELAAAGHRFRTRTDTEVIVHAFERWGPDAARRLRGMFAIAIWDTQERALWLARDRFGIKPLYYAQHNGRFAFASELKALIALLPGLPRRPDPTALYRLFEVGYIPAPLTPLAGVCRLPAAHWLHVPTPNAPLPEPVRYWQVSFPPNGEYYRPPPDRAVVQFTSHLEEAVAAWQLSDVPIGSLLSGGLDSSALARLLADAAGGPIHTFNIRFDAASHDESAAATAVAADLGSHHHIVDFTSAAFDRLPHAVAHLETPLCSATALPISLLYEACRAAGFKVILTGEGADELLGGYHWFDGDRRLRPYLPLPQPLRAALARLPLPVSPAGRRVFARGDADPIGRYALWQQVLPPAAIERLLGHAAPPLAERWRATYSPLLANRPPLHQLLLLEAHTRLPDFINLEVDRLSMAHSVEARPPFLDHELWEFTATLPPDYKLTSQGDKWLLRQAMNGRLPAPNRLRPKQGLATPHAAWWRQPRLPEWAEDRLTPAALARTALFDPALVTTWRAAHQSGRANHSRPLTGILTTQLWHEQFAR